MFAKRFNLWKKDTALDAEEKKPPTKAHNIAYSLFPNVHRDRYRRCSRMGHVEHVSVCLLKLPVILIATPETFVMFCQLTNES